MTPFSPQEAGWPHTMTAFRPTINERKPAMVFIAVAIFICTKLVIVYSKLP